MKNKVLIFLALIHAGSTLLADNWPRFRGHNGTGNSTNQFAAKWTETSFKWRTKLPGPGHGSPTVWNGRVFVLCGNRQTGERITTCVDATTGKIQWAYTHEAETHRTHKFNTFASSTPAADAERVYFSWGTPAKLTLIAYTHSGEKAWESDLGPVKGGHGFGASPVVYRDLILLNNDQDGVSSLIAVDRKTGKTRWSIPRDSKRLSYSSPCVYRNAKGEDEVIFTNWHHGITGVNPETGKVLWENDVFGKPSPERAIGSPVLAGELVIGSCGFVTKLKHIVALRPVPGKKAAEEVWRIERSVPHIPTALVVDHLIYLWNDQGIVTCAKNQTGEVLWNERVSGEITSSPVRAGDKIFCAAKDGKVTVIPANGKFEILAVNDLKEQCFSTPAIANGRMYFRTADHLIAVGN